MKVRLIKTPFQSLILISFFVAFLYFTFYLFLGFFLVLPFFFLYSFYFFSCQLHSPSSFLSLFSLPFTASVSLYSLLLHIYLYLLIFLPSNFLPLCIPFYLFYFLPFFQLFFYFSFSTFHALSSFHFLFIFFLFLFAVLHSFGNLCTLRHPQANTDNLLYPFLPPPP